MQTNHDFLGTLAGGVGGALVLTGLNEGIRRAFTFAPRLDRLGEQAVGRGLLGLGLAPVGRDQLRKYAFGSELALNSLIFGFAARGRMPILRGFLVGLAGGIAAVALPKRIGLSAFHRGLRRRTKLMTIGYYAAAGLCAGLLGRLVQRA